MSKTDETKEVNGFRQISPEFNQHLKVHIKRASEVLQQPRDANSRKSTLIEA